MKPAILSFERTAVLAVWSDVVLFDNMAHFVMLIKRKNVCVCVCMFNGSGSWKGFEKDGKNLTMKMENSSL